MRFIVFVIFIIASGSVSASSTLAETFSPQLLSRLDQCLSYIEHRYQEDPGFLFDLKEHCPDLSQLLARKEFNGYLQQPLEQSITIDQLMDLQSIGQTINTTATDKNAYRFDFQTLPALLQNTLVLEKEQDLSWWKRFLNWLAAFFEKNETKPPDWLKNWLSELSIPGWFVEAFYQSVVLMLAVFLLVIIVLELKAAGIRNWFKQRAQRLSLGQSDTTIEQHALLTWEAIAQLPPQQKITAAYKKTLHQLAQLKLIPNDTSLTNHELQSCLETSLGEKQPLFRQLISNVEAALYGEKAVGQEKSNTVAHSARQYTESLSGSTLTAMEAP